MSDNNSARFGIGAALTRTEDARLLTGQGRYTDDVVIDGALYGYVLRTGHAHASFTINEVSRARAAQGVHAVLISTDLDELNDLTCVALQPQPDGSLPEQRDIPLLCRDTVHHVGDAVAFIVADSLNEARDAAEFVDITYEPLPAVTNTGKALDTGANPTFLGTKSNLAFTHFTGDQDAVNAAFATAAHIAEIHLINNRLVCNYMEPRACIAQWHQDTDTYTVHLPSQGVHGMQQTLAGVLGTDPGNIRVITGDVGGGFGTKVFCYREYPLCLAAAKRLGRCVRWTSDRSEHFLQDAHGRDNVVGARMAMDQTGRFLALEIDLIAAMGAYLHAYGPLIPFLGGTMATGAYDIPCVSVATRGVFTNTTPVDAYRGAGRPEAAYLIERLVDRCAQVVETSVDDIRRRNFIKPDQFPYTTPTGRTYDVGEFEEHMNLCMQRACWHSFEHRRVEARSNGCLRGIGMATYIEACAFAGSEPAFLTLLETGRFVIKIGTQSNGQGHETAYAQIAAEALGVDYEEIDVRQGDTADLPSGGGTGGSRSIPLGGASTLRAGRTLATNLQTIAARELDVDPSDIVLEDGHARVSGGNAYLSFAEIAAAGTSEELNASGEWKQVEATYPNGTHICEVEIDLATGVTRAVAYTIVDDFGVTVNPLLLQGQVLGGVVQGIGQCLMEHVVYQDDGQLISATLLDYTLPRADDIPEFSFETRNVPSTANEMGIKGAGEAGTIGACPAVMNAVSNALIHEFDNGDIDMPITPLIMWKKLNELREAANA